MASQPRTLRMCTTTGKFYLTANRSGWGPEYGYSKFGGFYAGEFRSQNQDYYLVMQKADFSHVSHKPTWHYLFDFPENLEPGFEEFVNTDDFMVSVFHIDTPV